MHKRHKKHNPYKEANEAFLLVKAQEEGRGTKYPKPSGIVYVNFTGRLIDGTVFDSTDAQPLRLCSLSET